MPEIKVVTLGAGQDVGRSCVLVTIGGRNVMLDCGMHAGHTDSRKFPDFNYLCGVSGGNVDEYLSCIIISHFHLDHCGALPQLTEVVGFNGPIYMTQPTKAIAPVLLEDYRRIQFEYKGDKDMYTSQHIKQCMSKVHAVSLHETVRVDNDLHIRAFYAGHVLGAAIFELRCGNESVIYTGDYNTTPDRHLGAAQLKPGLKPDLLITETTYATTIRDSKRARERDFLKKVHDVVDRGGKVLIPVFALGRAQELCILIESYWERMDLKYPIYFSAGLAEKANSYYRLFINWTNEKIKSTFVHRNMFDFKHIRPFDMGMVDMPGPMVLFATPGMLHGGQSLRVFKHWAPDPMNMIIMPGYCVAGTPGHAVINGARKVTIEKQLVDVNLTVEYMSFSAHADAKGIMQTIKDSQPRHVMFVHGENTKMEFLKQKVEKEFPGIPVFKPANGETIVVPTLLKMTLKIPVSIIESSLARDPCPSKRHCPLNAFVALTDQPATDTLQRLKVLSAADVAQQIGQPIHQVSFTSNVLFPAPNEHEKAQFWWSVVDNVSDYLDAVEHPVTDCSVQYGEAVLMRWVQPIAGAADIGGAELGDSIGSLGTGADTKVQVQWVWEEDALAGNILHKLTKLSAGMKK